MPPGRPKFIPTEEDFAFARALRNKRQKRRLTQEALAASLGVSTRTYKRIEAGRSWVTPNIWAKLCERFRGLPDLPMGEWTDDIAKDAVSKEAQRVQEMLARLGPENRDEARLFVSWRAKPAPERLDDLTYDQWLLVRNYREMDPEAQLEFLYRMFSLRFIGRDPPKRVGASYDVPPQSMEEALAELHPEDEPLQPALPDMPSLQGNEAYVRASEEEIKRFLAAEMESVKRASGAAGRAKAGAAS